MKKRTSLHTISVLVENHFGALARIAGLFSARAYNIDSLTVGKTDDPTVSRMTIVVEAPEGEDRIVEQIKKQLNRLVDTIKVTELTSRPHVERELLLVTVSCTQAQRHELFQLCEVFEGKVVDITNESVMLEITGLTAKVEAIIKLLAPYGIRELARTGQACLPRESVSE